MDGIVGNVDLDVFYGASTSHTYKAKVTANSLNVRKGAGTSYGIVRVVKKDQILTILEEKDGWGKINDGWVSLKWLTNL